jgi:hypothetical protein
MSADRPRSDHEEDEPRPVVREGVFPWLPWPLRAMPSWTTPMRAERLAAVRIGLALFMLLDVLTSYWPLRRDFFGPESLGEFLQYEWYAQKGRQWWSILRGPADDLNFTLAFFGAVGLAVWIVLDTRTRWLGDDPRPPRPSAWLVVLFAFFATYALAGYWVRIMRDRDLALDSMFRTWMWLAPLVFTIYAILVWTAEAWVTYGLELPGPRSARPPHRYLTAWYVVAWGIFPLLVVMGFLLRDAEWTDANKGNLIRVALEPPLFHHGMIDGAMILWMLALASLMIGFQARVAAVIAWVMSTSFANVHPHIDNAGDTIRGIVLFYLIISPCGAVWSVDSWLRQRFSRKPRPAEAAVEVSPWPMCLLFMQLVVMYFMNGLYKVFTADWRLGRTLYFVLNDTTLTRFAFTELPITYQMTKWLTWSVLAWELSFPVLAINRYTRILALVFGVGFHLGIGISMDLGFFVPYALSIYLIFVPWEKWADARWRRRRHET